MATLMRNWPLYSHQRWPESLFQTPTLHLFQNFWIRVRLFFKYENSTPVQTPATINHPTAIYPYFYLRNDRTGSCYCQNRKETPGPYFTNFWLQWSHDKLGTHLVDRRAFSTALWVSSSGHFPGHVTRLLLNQQLLEWSNELSGKWAQHACSFLFIKWAPVSE